MSLKPGLHLGISHAAYHADPSDLPSLSSHIAGLVLRSPSHARLAHPRFGGHIERKQDDAMDAGAILHSMLLGNGPEIVEVEADAWRKKADKEKRDEALANGKIAILSHKLAGVRESFDGIKAKLPLDYSTAGCEVTALWESDGCPCRARMDAIFGGTEIDDLKTTEDASVASDPGNIVRSGYHVQGSAYIDAIETIFPSLAGRVSFTLTFVETSPPYEYIRVEIAGSMLELGRRRWERAKRIWAECLRTGEWPGYPREVQRPEAPAYALARDLEEQINQAGKEPF